MVSDRIEQLAPVLAKKPGALLFVFLFGGIAWATYFALELNRGPPIEYAVKAYRPLFEPPDRLIVQGDLIIREPCVGATVTAYFVAPGKTPEPAVRVEHSESAMVGKTTVPLRLNVTGVYPLAAVYQPPEWAQFLEWRLRALPECTKRPQGEIVVGVVKVPEPGEK